VQGNKHDRVAHLRPFGLPGGDVAVREGWRSAASLLFEVLGGKECGESRLPLSSERGSSIDQNMAKVRDMLARGINTVPTTSVGRLFDAVASFMGLAHQNRFEGQAAMLLENEIGTVRIEEAYPLLSGDWAPLIVEILKDQRAGVPVPTIAAKFHNALVNWIVEVAASIDLKDVVLSGGVFQNRYLTERAAVVLESRGFVVHTHRQVPPNDGGIALGQAVMGGKL
jgi:hydrogenase maturation protein HypF